MQFSVPKTMVLNTGAAAAVGLGGQLTVSNALVLTASGALAGGNNAQLIGTKSATFATVSANAGAEGNNAFLRSAVTIPMLVGLDQVKALAVGSTLSPRGYIGATRIYGPAP